MRDYIIRRLLLGLVTIFLVATVLFVILRVIPGDVVAALFGSEELSEVNRANFATIRRELGLDQPIYVQYGKWLWSLMQFDFGRSYVSQEPIWESVKWAIPVTLQLTLFAVCISVALAVISGTLSALRQDTWVDYFFRIFTITGLAMPSFWVAIVVVLGGAIYVGYFPPAGYRPPTEDLGRSIEQFILPGLILGWRGSAVVGRMIRSTVLEVLREDYVRTAYAKGLQQRVVVIRHVLKNASLPVITIIGFQISALLGGAVAIELIFGLPGMGRQLVTAITLRDLPVMQLLVMLFAVITVISNLVVDLAYGWLDPRVSYSGRGG